MTKEEIQRLVSEYFQRNLEDAEDGRSDGIGVLEGEDGVYGESGLEELELHLVEMIEDLARGELRSITRVADNIPSGDGFRFSGFTQETASTSCVSFVGRTSGRKTAS